MYNENNTYNIFKDTILALQNIKVKLLRNGIFFTKESINELKGFFSIQKYRIEFKKLDNNNILILTPLGNFNVVLLYDDVNQSIFNYLISKLNYLKTILSTQELNYLYSKNNVKMLYSFENFINSLIIRL